MFFINVGKARKKCLPTILRFCLSVFVEYTFKFARDSLGMSLCGYVTIIMIGSFPFVPPQLSGRILFAPPRRTCLVFI